MSSGVVAMTVQAGVASLAYDVMEMFWSSASTSDLARRQGRDAWPGRFRCGG